MGTGMIYWLKTSFRHSTYTRSVVEHVIMINNHTTISLYTYICISIRMWMIFFYPVLTPKAHSTTYIWIKTKEMKIKVDISWTELVVCCTNIIYIIFFLCIQIIFIVIFMYINIIWLFLLVWNKKKGRIIEDYRLW